MKNWTEANFYTIQTALVNLDQWLEKNGWAGYDPYDLRATSLFMYLQRASEKPSLLVKGLSRILYGLERRYPIGTRRLFGVKKQINPKGMGLLAKAYLELFEITQDLRYKQKALECLSWLKSNPAQGYCGMSWGYPFDWQSKVFIPKGTPSAVVSSVIGDAFWKAYRLFADSSFLEVCDQICIFFSSGLNIDKLDSEKICFSYTPVDDFHVHNANLFAAEFLIRIGIELDNQDYIQLGNHAVNYSLSEQNPDGSLYYWGKVQNAYAPNHLDHYHSGFEIRSLYAIGVHTQRADVIHAVQKYYRFYLENFWVSDDGKFIPKLTPASLYPIDIHTCAEALLCNAQLGEVFPEAHSRLPDVATWIIKTMQTKDGWFLYMLLKEGQRIEIPYLRWGQAWMLLALSVCWKISLSYLRTSENSGHHAIYEGRR